MGYLDRAEIYARMVNNGDMTLEEAAQQLSNDTNGGLTPLGAADVIADPAKAKDKFSALFDKTRMDLQRFKRQMDNPD